MRSIPLTISLVAATVALSLLGCEKKNGAQTTSAGGDAASGAAAAGTGFPAPPDVAAAPADAQKTESGLASKVLKPGTGTEKPNEWDTVIVHYTGWTKAGMMFDTSLKGEPISFGLGEVIKGWTEGMQLMVKGEKRRIWIPAALAYGDKPRNGAPGGDLVFDVELLEIKPGKKPPPAPADVKEAPADAKKTASGLAYRVLTPGKGAKKPMPLSKVRVHYTGWTKQGKMFDSSVERGEPAEFALNRVIPGWTEGLQLMVEGEKTRFWIPSEMAYGDKPQREGAPAGMLVFDVELLDILTMPDGGAAKPSDAGAKTPPATPADPKKTDPAKK